jgi:hypothetical protein
MKINNLKELLWSSDGQLEDITPRPSSRNPEI